MKSYSSARVCMVVTSLLRAVAAHRLVDVLAALFIARKRRQRVQRHVDVASRSSSR
jgi:hypothetical protein